MIDPITEIRARLEAILSTYPLPWTEHKNERGHWYMRCGESGNWFVSNDIPGSVSTWMESAPGDIAHLLDEVERLRPLIEAARNLADAVDDAMTTNADAVDKGVRDVRAALSAVETA